MKPFPLIPLGLAMAVILTLPACRKAAEDQAAEAAGDAIAEVAVEQATGLQTHVASDGTVTLNTPHGGTATTTTGDEALPMPPDFPKDVYVPADAKVRNVLDMQGMRSLDMVSATSAAQVNAELDKAMKASGWTTQVSLGGAMQVWEKAGRNAIYTISQTEDGKTGVSVRLTAP